MAIEVIAEEVANNLEEVAEATRRINAAGLGYLGTGVVLGAAAGLYFGYKLSRKKALAQAYEEADAEIAEMQEFYRSKEIAAQPKPDLDETVQDLGYKETVTVERPLPSPVPIMSSSGSIGHVNYGGHSVEETPEDDLDEIVRAQEQEPDVVYPPWDNKRELAGRNPGVPYVIHLDEFVNSDFGFEKVEYDYYDVDDVVAGEDNRPILVADEVVGLDNLKWGYGSEDPDVVYIRNHRLEREIMLRRLRGRSYEVEVMGLDDADTP